MGKRGPILISLGVFLVTLMAVALIQARTPAPLQDEATPPPPPTPGPPPTYAYEELPGEPVDTAEMAIQIVLKFDNEWTSREPPLSRDALEANPDMVVVERYATRQEAEDIYSGAGIGIPEAAAEPVWVVRIKGTTPVRVIGGRGRVVGDGHDRPSFEDADEVIYMISQRTGHLLGINLSSGP